MYLIKKTNLFHFLNIFRIKKKNVYFILVTHLFHSWNNT